MFHKLRTRLPKGTKTWNVRTGIPKEQRPSRAYFLEVKGDDPETLNTFVADYLDLLDFLGYTELCQTEHARTMVAS